MTSSESHSTWALLAFLPWLMLLAVALKLWQVDVARKSRTKTTAGRIVKVEYDNHHQYDYEYSVDGRTYSGVSITGGEQVFGAAPQLRVAYDSDHPEVSTLKNFGELGTRPVPVLFFLVPSVCGYVRLRNFLKQ